MANVISGICAAMRPLAKELIKCGISAVESVSEFVAETGEQVKDLVAEAKSELASEDKGRTATDETIAGNATRQQHTE